MLKFVFLSILLYSSIYALQDLGTYGATHSIKEENFMDKVERHSKDLNTSLIEEQFYASKKKFLEVEKIVPICTETIKRQFTPTFVVPYDVVLPNGEVIAKAGERRSTLELMKKNNMSINKYMIFIDAHDILQVQLAYMYKNQGFVFITNGSIDAFDNKTKISSFKADTQSIEKFDIKCSPSIVIQEENQLAIYEYSPSDLQSSQDGVEE